MLGGLGLALIPGIPDVHLDPDLVLLVFLPPLLYASAFFSDLRTLRNDARVIAINAIGLTLATAAIVGVIAHELIGLPWAVSLALGAIVSPTDPAAATAVMRRVGAPRRMVNILEGESLVNDAAALVTFKVAVALAVGESVSAGHTVLTFAGDVAGGAAIGLPSAGRSPRSASADRRVNTELTISLFSAYGAFVPADQLGVSGVLAVVAADWSWAYALRRSPRRRAGCRAFALWSILTFLLNATLFILIGLQLPVIVDGTERPSAGEVIGYAAAICAAVIAIRFVWLFATTAVIRTVDRRRITAGPARHLAFADRELVVGDARGSLTGGGACAAAAHQRRCPAARP